MNFSSDPSIAYYSEGYNPYGQAPPNGGYSSFGGGNPCPLADGPLEVTMNDGRTLTLPLPQPQQSPTVNRYNQHHPEPMLMGPDGLYHGGFNPYKKESLLERVTPKDFTYPIPVDPLGWDEELMDALYEEEYPYNPEINELIASALRGETPLEYQARKRQKEQEEYQAWLDEYNKQIDAIIDLKVWMLKGAAESCGHRYTEAGEKTLREMLDPRPKKPIIQQPVELSPEEKVVRDCERLGILAEAQEAEAQKIWMMQRQREEYMFESCRKLLYGDQEPSTELFDQNSWKLVKSLREYQDRQVRKDNIRKLYSPLRFAARLSQECGGDPIPIFSRTDEYISVEEMLKPEFESRIRNCEGITCDREGNVSFVKRGMTDSEFDRHHRFLEAVQAMMDEDKRMRGEI